MIHICFRVESIKRNKINHADSLSLDAPNELQSFLICSLGHHFTLGELLAWSKNVGTDSSRSATRYNYRITPGSFRTREKKKKIISSEKTITGIEV